ncbi:MAG TPA: TIGR03617 family F420-dependent LLM class oxidoreductase [Acidimicrobiales bacterium]
MHIDQSLIGHTSAHAADSARWAEDRGFDAVWATESVTDGFLQSLSAVQATERIPVGTAIVVAFARNPMTTAYAAWDLAAVSGGRFVLGLGSQVRQHIERRFSMPWSDPVERMRDYIAALRAIWTCWRDGERLAHEGPYYRHTLMNPVFTPPRHEHRIPVAVAAVGPRMTRLAGEVCDGVILHGMTTVEYLDRVTLPALDAGLAASGRTRADVFLSLPVFMVMGDSDEELERARARAREQIAFYASTPAYRAVLESVGYGDLQPELQRLSREGAWQAMSDLIDDRLYDAIAFTGRPEDMPRLVRDRLGDRIDRTSSYFGWPVMEPDRLAEILDRFRGTP